MMTDIEGVSQKFNIESYLEARKVAQRISLLFASHVDAGMTEEDGHKIIENLFQMHNVEKTWHPTKVRFGKNTTKTFREKSEDNVVLKDTDIYFLDIGPVINGHEADIGHTYTIGQNQDYAHAQRSAREIFNEAKSLWEEKELSGVELYNEVKRLTEKKGYLLDEKMMGHRLGDFPHALFYKGKLSDFEKHPISNLWVLEVHIQHPTKEFGAFFEDILIKSNG
jgi:Xaa-Pro aminopeptidase